MSIKNVDITIVTRDITVVKEIVAVRRGNLLREANLLEANLREVASPKFISPSVNSCRPHAYARIAQFSLG